MKSFNIVVCASGGGGNFRSLIKYQCDYGYHISLLIVDRECPAIKIAKENGISYSVLEKKVLGKSFFEEFEKIVPIDTNLIVLAGFLPIIPKWICEKWERKMKLNSLLTKFITFKSHTCIRSRTILSSRRSMSHTNDRPISRRCFPTQTSV